MNCSKCNASNKPGSKFCTTCGSKFDIQSNNIEMCNGCGATIKPSAKFCTTCGTPINIYQSAQDVNVNNSEIKSISIIKDRIFWNIQKNEVAHRFNEAEMVQYDSAKGIIINEGTTAYIRANGIHVAEIKGGTYDFIEAQKLEETLNARHGGVVGSFRAGFRFLSNLILGQRVKDIIHSDNSTQTITTPTTMASLIESMKKGQVFSVTLKLDKSFPLFFEIHEIETKILNVSFGMHGFFIINDFKKFSDYYLSDSNSVSFERIMKEFEPIIRVSIQDIIHDYEIKESRLPDDIVQKIKEKIESTVAEHMHGVRLEKIVEISSKSEDLLRFREMSRELYLSERELDFLHRINEFNNRLTSSQNTQRLHEARTDSEFLRELRSINNSNKKENLLSDDEMDKFYMLLSREKRIREARNEDEINTALLEIEKTGLIREEDLENLKRSIRERSEDHDFERFHSVTLLQMNQNLEIDRKRLEWEYEIGDKRIDLEINRKRKELQADIGYTELEITRWKTEDDYKDSVFYKELEKKKVGLLQDIEIRKRERESEIDLDNKEMDAQLERMRKLKDIEAAEARIKHEQELKLQAQQIAHQQEMEEKRLKEVSIKYQASKELTPEQLMAIAANEKLDPVAAQKFAESFSAKHNTEHQKEFMAQFNKLNELRVQDSKEMMDRMERMFNRGLDSSSSISGHLLGLKDQQKDEYRERLERQEDRIDKTQDKALDYTTRNNSFININRKTDSTVPPIDYFVNLPGENSIPRKLDVLINMVKSGQVSSSTSVFNPFENKWVPASSITELQSFFLPESNINLQNRSVNNSCRKCGYGQLEINARFCPECGNEP